MHASLCFGSRHALYAMYPRFVFKGPVHLFSAHGKDDFLETAGRSFTTTGQGHFPAFHLAILHVHAIQVSGKECGFVTARSATYFDNGVFVVLRVGRYEEQLDLLFQFRNARFAGSRFFAGYFSHLRIGFGHHQAGLFQAVETLHIFLTGFYDFVQLLIFFRELDVSFLVSDDVRVRDECRYLFEARYQSVQFL